MNLLIVIPAKDEERYIQRMLNSIKSQTHSKFTCVVVDDASADGTPQIVEEMQKMDQRFQLVRREGTEQRSGGSKVVRAFYVGYNQYVNDSFDVIMKLDADLELPSNYFATVVAAFQKNDRLGVCGGYCLVPNGNGGYYRENSHWFHVRGALKAYRRACWDEIGGFKETWNWDGIDTLAALMKGWDVLNLEIGVTHFRPTSAAYDKVQHAFRSGEEAFKLGNDLGLALIKAAGKMVSSKNWKVFVHYLKGYYTAKRNGEQLVIEPELASFIRSFTYKRLIGIRWKKN